jgi:hypothetical protein
MTRKLALILLLISFAGASAAQAATISFVDSYGPVAVPFGAADLATLSQFDPSLGTLTKVTLTLDASTSAGTIRFDNEALIATDATLGIGAEVTAIGLAGITAIAVPLQTNSVVNLAADNDGAADFIGTDAFGVTGGSGFDSDFDELTAGLAPYIGLGSFNVTVSAVVETFLSTTGGFGPIDPVPGNTFGNVTVTYEYTPIPEPSTAVLVGFCLVGAVAVARRRAP